MTTRVEIVNDFLAINVKPGSTIQDVVEAPASAITFFSFSLISEINSIPCSIETS